MTAALRNRNRQLALGLCGVLLAFVAGSVANAAPVAGSVSRVTLYRGQALVTREVPVAGKDGALELVVGDLPAQVVPDSLFAEGSDAVEVRAVRFRSRAVGEEPQQEIRKLDDAIEELNLKLAANRKSLELAARQAIYLDQLDGFVAPRAKQDLSKGVLDAKALQEVTKFSFERREKIAERQLALDKEARTLTADLALLQRKRAEVAGKATRTVHEALLFLVKRGAADATVRVNYLVGGCGWAPAYTLHAGADRKQVEVQYSALIQQMTGESWDDVALTLSTASPAISARGPGLAPFHVVLGPAVPNAAGRSYGPSDLSSQVKDNNDRRNMAVQQAQQGYMLADEIGNAWTCNTVAMQIQNLELLGGRDIVRVLRTVDAEAPSISYRLKERVSLASRADQQTVRSCSRTCQASSTTSPRRFSPPTSTARRNWPTSARKTCWPGRSPSTSEIGSWGAARYRRSHAGRHSSSALGPIRRCTRVASWLKKRTIRRGATASWRFSIDSWLRTIQTKPSPCDCWTAFHTPKMGRISAYP